MALSSKDFDTYKSGVDKLVYRYLSHERHAASSTITNAIDSGLEKRKLAEKLTAFTDRSVAHKLADKAFLLVEDLGLHLKSTSKKRSHKNDDSTDVQENKKPRSMEENDISNAPSGPGTLQQQQIKDIMAQAQAAIEQRKKALSNLQVSSSQGTINRPPAFSTAEVTSNGAAPAPLTVNSRIAELQARIRSQMGSLPAIPPVPLMTPAMLPTTPMTSATPNVANNKPPGERPPPIILDSEGRTLDLSGKEVHITSRVPTLKANIRAKKREEFKQQLAEKPPLDETPDANYFDPRVPVRPSQRQNKMQFKFHEPGKFVQLAQRERAKSRLEKLQGEIFSAARRTGISSATRLAQLQKDVSEESYESSETPIVEWWDAVILGTNSYPKAGEQIRDNEHITNLVEHPLQMKCQSDLTKPVELKVYLTAKERKKLRRMNRREAWKEKQDKIRLGLEPPPEAKVKMANLMRVLGTEAVLDPTKMEKHVRDQMAKRLEAHKKANAERKLTPQQKKEKRVNKLKEDTSTGVHVSVYRVTDLSNGSHKFKVETNAKQLFMTGTVVLFRDVNVVVVEGGPKQQKKYRRLMMNRIKWVEEARSSNSDVEPKCQLVWEGTVLERNFGEMQFKACPSETFARDYLKRHGVEQYWDMAYGKKVEDETDFNAL